MKNPLFTELFPATTHKFPQESVRIKNDHIHQLRITKTIRNKFMKYTLPLIGQFAHVAYVTKTQQVDHDNKHISNITEVMLQLNDKCTLDVDKNILKFIQLIFWYLCLINWQYGIKTTPIVLMLIVTR